MLKRIANLGELKKYLNEVELPDDAEIIFRVDDGNVYDITYAYDPFFDRDCAEVISEGDVNIYAKEHLLTREQEADIKKTLVVGYMDEKQLRKWIAKESEAEDG